MKRVVVGLREEFLSRIFSGELDVVYEEPLPPPTPTEVLDLETYHSGLNKERKHWLSTSKRINCGHCPYHRRENARPFARKRSDRHKDHRG